LLGSLEAATKSGCLGCIGAGVDTGAGGLDLKKHIIHLKLILYIVPLPIVRSDT
jgi:hypothetical protein